MAEQQQPEALAQIAAILQQLQQQNQQAQQQAAAGPAQPQYALTPGRANPGAFIDYNTRAGIDLYKMAIAALPHKFDVDSSQITQFVEDLRDRAKSSGWSEAGGNIITIPDSNGTNHDLITNYGELTVTDVRNHAITYMGNQVRAAQNSQQMYECIMNSLTEAGKNKILNESSEYTVANEFSGTLLFKLLMKKTVIDTRATSSAYRTNLSSLDSYMATVDSDIELFNQYVKGQQEGLKARGEDCPDLMINLFKGYNACADPDFRRYVLDKKDKYHDGEDITPEKLMKDALNKFKTMKLEGTWRIKSPEEQQIIALSAKVDELKDQNLKLSKAVQNAGKQGSSKSNSQTKSGGGGKGKSKSNSNKGKGKSNSNQHSWKQQPPKPGDPTSKTVDGKIYNWCKYHEAWVQHDPDGDGPNACRLRKKLEQDGSSGRSSSKSSGSSANDRSSNRRGPFHNAISAIIEEYEEDSE